MWRQLGPAQGRRLNIEVLGGCMVLRTAVPRRAYKAVRRPKSGLPIMVVKAARRRATAADIARLQAEVR